MKFYRVTIEESGYPHRSWVVRASSQRVAVNRALGSYEAATKGAPDRGRTSWRISASGGFATRDEATYAGHPCPVCGLESGEHDRCRRAIEQAQRTRALADLQAQHEREDTALRFQDWVRERGIGHVLTDGHDAAGCYTCRREREGAK